MTLPGRWYRRRSAPPLISVLSGKFIQDTVYQILSELAKFCKRYKTLWLTFFLEHGVYYYLLTVINFLIHFANLLRCCLLHFHLISYIPVHHHLHPHGHSHIP